MTERSDLKRHSRGQGGSTWLPQPSEYLLGVEKCNFQFSTQNESCAFQFSESILQLPCPSEDPLEEESRPQAALRVAAKALSVAGLVVSLGAFLRCSQSYLAHLFFFKQRRAVVGEGSNFAAPYGSLRGI